MTLGVELDISSSVIISEQDVGKSWDVLGRRIKSHPDKLQASYSNITFLDLSHRLLKILGQIMYFTRMTSEINREDIHKCHI